MSGGGEPELRARRLFFALWPDPSLRQALAAATSAAVAAVDGRPIPAANFHVTLAFLGTVPGRGFGDLVKLGAAGGDEPVELVFDRLEHWVKPQLLVALASVVPDSCRRIVDRLWRGLEPLGFTREPRPWLPHLTLARRVRRTPPASLSISPAPAKPWHLALVESATLPEGTRYTPVAEWHLV